MGETKPKMKKEKVLTVSDGFRFPLSILKYGKDGKLLHPSQKPVALCEYLINTYSNEKELVLDNCVGSGTTAIACINTNRNFIGFENDPKYFEIANKRISDRLNQK